MAFSVMCNGVGAAPIAPHHGLVNFDFNQALHPAFGALGVGVVAGAPAGCCLALTMEWMHNWNAHPNQPYSVWVNPAVGVNPNYPNAGGGHANILPHMVLIVGGGAGWAGACNGIMAVLGFANAGGLIAGPAWGAGGAVAAAALALTIQLNRFTILVVSGGANSHAVGFFRAGQSFYFFDANHGQVFFPSAADCANWFYGGGYAAAALIPMAGAAPNLHTLRYN